MTVSLGGLVEENDATGVHVVFFSYVGDGITRDSFDITDDRFEILAYGSLLWQLKLKIGESLDHESHDGSFELTFSVTDDEGNASTETVSIVITDVNEAPVFMHDSYTETISEDITVGSAIETLVAQDVDDGDSLTYSITDGNEDGFFDIDAKTGRVIITDLDAWTARTIYKLTVVATDSVGLTDTADLTIKNPAVGTGDDDVNNIVGTRDPDTIYGYGGNDIIKGGNGDDTLYGGAGNDNIRGNGGSDTLFGGAGNNILRGNSGKDFFVLNTDGSGTDTVKDFKTSHDDKIRVYVDPEIDTLGELLTAFGLWKAGSTIYKIVDNLDVVTNEDNDIAIMELENFDGGITDAMFDFVAPITLSTSGDGHVAENDDSGADTAITLTVTHSNITLTSANFAVSDERFEIEEDGNNWKFGLKNGEMLDYESAGEHEITVWVSDDINTATIKVNVEVTNADDGDATVTISGHEVGLVSVDDILTATLGEDPDGLNSDVAVTYRWFHKGDPDKDIGTGSTYTVANTDDGKIIGVEVGYTDNFGATPSVTEITELTVGAALRVIRPPKGEEDKDHTLMPLFIDEASRIEGGNGADTITDGTGDDIIDGGPGDDRIDLGADMSGSDSDKVIYRIGDGSVARDGADIVTNFERGKDKIKFILERTSETADIDDYDGFLDYITGGTPDDLIDDKFWVNFNFDFDAEEATLEGISFHFRDGVFFSGGRLSSPIFRIEFADPLTVDEVKEVYSGRDKSTPLAKQGLLADFDYLDDFFGSSGDFQAIEFQVAEPDMV